MRSHSGGFHGSAVTEEEVRIRPSEVVEFDAERLLGAVLRGRAELHDAEVRWSPSAARRR
jgi:hypothetical protein